MNALIYVTLEKVMQLYICYDQNYKEVENVSDVIYVLICPFFSYFSVLLHTHTIFHENNFISGWYRYGLTWGLQTSSFWLRALTHFLLFNQCTNWCCDFP
jgi:hypothetical protein